MMNMLKKLVRKLIGMLSVFSPLFSRKSKISTDDARKRVEAYSAKPNGQPIRNNSILEPVCDLQIIIPAYNVEKYLKDCLDSILTQQTKYSFKVVVIDDGSTDTTGEIADQYSNSEKVVVIHQENRGFSGARNRGLEKIFAEYIMFVDSDDMLCPGAIEAMMDTALEYDSDIVEGGAQHLRNGKLDTCFAYPRKQELPTALGVFHGQPWAKVYKADCFRNIVFPEGYWFEDSILSFLIYPVKTRVSVVNQFVYIYRVNNNGITATHKKRIKAVDTYWVIEALMETRRQIGLAFDDAFLKKMIRQFVLNQSRIEALQEDIQESIFVLSSELLSGYFDAALIENNKKSTIVRALTTRDWGMYKFYCKFN